ncbi:ABC transporter permease [Streptococcus sp. X16XC17]|uniref:ABC transporter permease n=1 Tax=unclassified Streptococcus TaxID=2608887 RepID=UPI00066FE8AE|nr:MULTISPECIES: ABC transporter permease [unclassified Streptococcus]TCD46409.1 ABC transporter permease [Streptococcus sp. X16XC17]
MSKKTQKWAVPLIAVLLGLVAGAVIMLVFGYDPIAAYSKLLSTAFGSPYNIGEIGRAMAPLILIGLGFAVSSKAGFFNVGLPGQALIGWTAAAWFALETQSLPKVVSIPLTILVACIAGGFAGAIPGALRAYLGTSEVIVTIMLNYIILYTSNAVVNGVLLEKFSQKGSDVAKIPENASYQVEWLSGMFGNSRINLGLFFALIAVALIWFLLKKTIAGYEITAVGLNPHAAEYAGISSKKMIILSMVISGALSGLGGAVDGLGTYEFVKQQDASLSIGFNGMAVALLAANSPIGIPFAALLFGILEIGKSGMQAIVPPEIVDVISALIIFFVGINYIIKHFIKPGKVKGGK